MSFEGEGRRYMVEGRTIAKEFSGLFGGGGGVGGEGSPEVKVRKRWQERKEVRDRHGNLMEYAPREKRARKNGYVPVKVMVAQRMLGRVLGVDERVELRDGDVNNVEAWNLGVRRVGSKEVKWLVEGRQV